MAVKLIVAHRADPNNVGDIASNPLQYFLEPDEYQIIDVAKIGSSEFDEDIPLVVGGGGLVGNQSMGDFYEDLLYSPDRLQIEKLMKNHWKVVNPKYQHLYGDYYQRYQRVLLDVIDHLPKVTAPRFIWGAGHNSNDKTEFADIAWPEAWRHYKAIGLRDWHEDSMFNWAPCASCMHPAFNSVNVKKYKIKNKVIWFEHKKQLIKDFGDDAIPRFVNSGNNIEHTIELLGSTEIILTNSYHGAYWGTLLRKKVIVVGGAWSTKFNWMKHPPIVLSRKQRWQDVVDEAPIYKDALEECRTATEKHWMTIKGML